MVGGASRPFRLRVPAARGVADGLRGKADVTGAGLEEGEVGEGGDEMRARPRRLVGFLRRWNSGSAEADGDFSSGMLRSRSDPAARKQRR